MTTVQQGELAERIAKGARIRRAIVDEVLQSLLDEILQELCRGNKVTLQGFATLERRRRKERPGVNPRTLERIRIPASHSVRFSPGALLRRRLNEEVAYASDP